MDIILLVVLSIVAGLYATHLIIKRRARAYNLLRLKLFAGNITPEESDWLQENPNAKYSTKHRVQKIYHTVRHFPTVIKKKIEDHKREKERNKERAEAREKRKNRPYKPNEGSLRDSTPIKLVNIANEIGNPDGISEVATNEEFLSRTDSEEEWFQSVPPTRA